MFPPKIIIVGDLCLEMRIVGVDQTVVSITYLKISAAWHQ